MEQINHYPFTLGHLLKSALINTAPKLLDLEDVQILGG